MNLRTTRSIVTSFGLALALLLVTSNAFAAISFVSATNSLNLVETVDDNGNSVFVFGGIADGDSSVLSFSTDSACPGVAMTGGAEFTANWSCESGVISATVTNRGGMSFGPAPEGSPATFYVTFSNPPAPPGQDAAPAELSGIQISIFGDVSSWDLSGEPSSSGGVTFGVELSGTSGGEAHFRMDLPQAAVTYLGGVLGVFVGGRLDPFATVTTNDDGSVQLKVDIASLSTSSRASAKPGTKASSVTKKITTGERSLGIGFSKKSVKSGKSVALAMCTGKVFTAGTKIPITFTVGGKRVGITKSFKLDSKGCARTTVKLASVSRGTLTAKISHKRKNAKATIKVT